MGLSTVTAFAPIPEKSEATPGLFNARLQTLQDNIVSMNSLLAPISTNTIQPESGNTVRVLNGKDMILRSIDSGGAFFNVKAFGAVGDGTTDDTSAIQAAIDAAAAVATDACIFLPPGQYKITSALTGASGVNITGAGGTISVLKPVACNAISMEWYGVGFGNVVYSNFGITGTSCTTRTALINAGTLDEGDQFYGLTLEKLLVQNYQKGVALRSTRNVLITECWFQTVSTGVDLTGYNLVARIRGNFFVYNGGSGSGTTTGILLDRFNFSSGAGLIGPEGVQIQGNQIYGFSTGINVAACNYTNILDNDISATSYGIEFTTAQNGFTVRDNYVEVSGASSQAGIIGHGLGSTYQSRAVIADNTVISSDNTAPYGIQINDAANQNQDNVRILNNLVTGFSTNDILVNNGNDVAIIGNRLRSTGPTYSIKINAGLGPGPIIVDQNECAKELDYNANLALSGIIRLGNNIFTGARHYGHSVVTDGSALAPSIRYGSESSLGFYRSGASTIAPSYGTVNLASNAVRLSMRTIAASALTASAANTNVATNEVVFTIGGASGASLAIHSGGTVYVFNSATSARAT